uniref:BTB domain-containing protein n=1 Tax=Globisporangium ultimum (strain ATCC 200006 / CBS 805.95 / DAOM BR144) TaxID=431595 RepID=K3X4D5_GLOUD
MRRSSAGSVRFQDDTTPAEHGAVTAQDAADMGAASDSGSSPRFVPIASSPLDTPTMSGEDDDYRSETSSEAPHSRRFARSPSNCSSDANVDDARTPHTVGTRSRKHVTSAYSNHRDLSLRLKRAVANGDEDGGSFGEDMIGADVVLCVKSQRSTTIATGANANSGAMDASVKKFHAHRFMLAASSEPFRAMLTGRMREASQREVDIYGVEPHTVEKMLLFIYTGDVVLDLDNVVGLLIASEMYELAALREICKSFVLYHAHDVFRNPQIVQLPEKLLLEVIEHDELQIREMALLDALVGWGEARVESAGSTPILEILGDVMEHVRFATMSVSDLYGKVRPLVRDGIIQERLLTEALFHHLKWGTPSGRASQRMKPRALAAALRKRKRVSFIQHVSFVEE